MENPPHYMFLKGIPLLPNFHKEELMAKLQDEVEFQDKDVILVTYPKSGTHWMIDILSLIYSKGDPTWVKSASSWKRSPWIEHLNSLEVIKTKADPRLFTSHLPIHLFPKSDFISKAKVIYVARNPKDVLVSFYNFVHELPIFQSFSNFYGLPSLLPNSLLVLYGSWFDHVKGWLPLNDSKNFLFLTYEELHQDLKVSVEKICQFLDKDLSEEEISSVIENASFQVMKNHMLENNEAIIRENVEPFKVMVLRKGICGEWKNYFTVTQMETFNNIYQENMKGLGQNLFPWDQC
ncbi:sulfotransferase 2A1-like [Macrotis lagotis]|uniref:sulfotransferase 2A1-like n=1 Tax=Macrotis lagotis TaxID=92651 RepID=UPI003D69865E